MSEERCNQQIDKDAVQLLLTPVGEQGIGLAMHATNQKRWREPEDHAVDIVTAKKNRQVFLSIGSAAFLFGRM